MRKDKGRKTHVLDIEERFYNDIVRGLKTFEVRSLKHKIQVGDLIQFNVLYEGEPPSPTEPVYLFEVTYKLEGYGIEPGHAVYSIVPDLPHFLDITAEEAAEWADNPVQQEAFQPILQLAT